MNEEQSLAIFHSCGAILEGHFQLTSGLHSPRYLQCALVLQYPHYCEQLSSSLAEALTGRDITTVLSPALGGIIVGYEVARKLSARFLFSERIAGGSMALRRGFQINAGETVAVIEDVCTTGGSANEVIALARSAGATVTAVGALIDRSGGSLSFDVPSYSLIRLQVPSFLPEECPQCKQGGTAVKPGSR